MANYFLVRKIEMVDAASITSIFRHGTRTVVVETSSDWEEINMKPRPALSIESKVTDGEKIYSVKVTGLSPNDLSGLSRKAFRVTLVTGNVLLIGSNQRPYPIVTVSESAPTKESDEQFNSVSISYSSEQIPPYLK